jgi:CubicO group peptidase (beta-lactamase class C family)
MSSAIESEIESALAAARVPGAVVAWAHDSGPPEIATFGADADGLPLDREGLFPVASITKLATALAVLRLVDQGRLGLDDELAAHLPDAAATGPGVTLRRLLSHTAGLPLDVAPGLAPYRPGLDWPALASACLATALAREPGTYVQYSNTGYGLLAAVVERTTRASFPAALLELVLDPLGVEGYLGAEPPRPPVRLADVRGSHAGTDLQPYNSAFWRGLAAPWGGLVTTATGALALVRASLGHHASDFLSPALRADAVANQTDELPGGMARPLLWERCPWGLGPELRGDKTPHWSPPTASPGSFGHAGASGSLAWADPAHDLAWVVLGARTADSGWLLRQGAAIGAALLRETAA